MSTLANCIKAFQLSDQDAQAFVSQHPQLFSQPDPQSTDMTMIFSLAAQHGRSDVVRCMLSAMGSVPRAIEHALIAATVAGKSETVGLILPYASKAVAGRALITAVIYARQELVGLIAPLADQPYVARSFLQACICGQVTSVHALLAYHQVQVGDVLAAALHKRPSVLTTCGKQFALTNAINDPGFSSLPKTSQQLLQDLVRVQAS